VRERPLWKGFFIQAGGPVRKRPLWKGFFIQTGGPVRKRPLWKGFFIETFWAGRRRRIAAARLRVMIGSGGLICIKELPWKRTNCTSFGIPPPT
jgi:hypothetical protein